MDIQIAAGFVATWILVVLCAVITCGAFATRFDKLSDRLNRETMAIAKSLQQKADVLEIIATQTRPKISIPPGNVKIEAVRKAPVYDFESSQRATLEEFKEQP